MTKVRTYRIDIDENAQQGDAIVIGTNGGMTSQHLGTAASLDAGACAGNVPILDTCGKLPDSTIQDGAMKASVYDTCNKQLDVYDYRNFDNTPTIPVVNDPTVTFTQGGVTVGSISLNQSGNTNICLMAGGVTAGDGIDINCNEVSVKYDSCSLGVDACNKLNVKDYDTIASGAAAGATAVQANDLATVAMSGKYCDLSGKPEIPSAQIQADWCQTNTDLADYIKNKPTIGDATITIQKNGTNVDCFTLNQTANKCLNITLSKEDVGLCNVDNTSDANKPVSTAMQTALNCKQDNITDLNTIRCDACAGKAASETIANYGDIVSHNACEFATASQGGKADTAVQPGDLATVATSGKYCDLSGQPTIPTDNCQLANSCGYTTCTGTLVSSDLNPYAKTCTLCSVATSGKYCDLTGTPTIPTDNCQLSNGCGYITNAVDNLTNYYLKCETYKKCEVDNLISNFGGFEVVSTLPTTNIKTNVIYLLGPIGTGADKYEEWIYYNNTWTKIGETTTDLSNYAKCCDIPTDNCQLGNSCGYTTCTGTLVANDLQPYAKTCTLCTVATTGKYCDLTGKPTIPTDNCQLANSCGYTTCTGTLVSSDLEPYAKSCDLKTVATSGKYCDLTGTPTLCTVATSGKYCDLSGTPSLCTVATSGKYCDLSGTPSLATVATSGCYNDLTGKPTIPTDNCQLGNSCNYITKDVTNLTCYTPTASLSTVATSGAYCDLTGTPTLACVATSGCYDDLSGKPNLGVYQTTSCMVCSLTGADDSHYPTAKTVADALSSCGAGDMLKATYDPCNKNSNAFDYNNFINTPNLCAVATSGQYCDLTGTPAIPPALSAGDNITITNNCINANIKTYIINEDAFDVTYTGTKGVAPYNECYCYTNVCINPNCGIKWDEGATYIFNLDTKVATSKCRNVRLKIGDGDYIPLMGTTTAAAGSTYFVKSAIRQFQYSTKYEACGALHLFTDTNSTYSAMTQAEIDDGTATTGRTMTAACLKYAIDRCLPTDNCQLSNGCGYITSADLSGYAKSCDLKTVATSGQYCDLTGTPTLCTVATSGKYCDLSGTPDLSCKQDVLTLGTNLHYDSSCCLQVGDANNDLQGMRYVCASYFKTSSGNLTSCPTAIAVLDANGWICKQTPSCFLNNMGFKTVATSGCYCDLTGTPTIPTDNCQLANSCGYTTCTGNVSTCADIINRLGYTPYDSSNPSGYTSCTGTLVPSDLNGYAKSCDLCAVATSGKYCDLSGRVTDNCQIGNSCGYAKSSNIACINGCCLTNGGNVCIQGGEDYSWKTKSGSSFNLDLRSYIEPTQNFTVNVPGIIKDGEEYVLRVVNDTAYTMTLGSCFTNPHNVSLALSSKATDQFVFVAINGELELQPQFCIA